MSMDTGAAACILVVEDEWLIGDLIEDILSEAGFRVCGPAGSVEQALLLLKNKTIDAAILDINLGTERSFPIAERLKEQGTPFMFMTGYTASEVPEEFSGSPIMSKPLAPVHLITAVQQLLHR
ncbi:response regulator [Polymorphobacter multimanifer]|uniref:DNA-binding response OmpR family regulator n=1 Tax=Polymorphobacter multimanifer TaxID=1070431 RepID=A0A841L0W0_9SPHN|nr:response regulator [Polymorphobacter multimanifer]MBB6226317.1 DNA-binding response OmpR family regulator [Polymorphobacter multimanifer]GGI81186.1 response regulator [Polymorphobacter multimanifer]